MNAELKNAGKRVFEEKVYRDVPIIRTAASMINGGVPPEYRALRKLGNTLAYSAATEAVIFYEQAKLMARFSDDCPYAGEFSAFYPNYRIMTLSQQRGYFTWRAKVRAGETEKTCTSFVFVYIYELLNLIGCDGPEDAFRKLRDFNEAYRPLDPTPDRYVKPWLRDLAVYYGLDRSFLEDCTDLAYDRFLSRLMDPEKNDDAALYEALEALSSARPDHSRFYRENPEDFQAVACRVYRALSAYYASHRKSSYCEMLFGRLRAMPCTLFSSAVFYDRRRAEDRRYEISPFHVYVCCGGRWTCYRCAGGTGKSTELGAFFRNLDAAMREYTGFPHPLKPGNMPKVFTATVKKEIAAYYAEKAAAEKRRVKIDFSALDAIRAAADETCEKLMTDAERNPAPETAELPIPPAAAAQSSAPAEPPARETAEHDALSLDADETAFVRALLAGEDPAPDLRKKGLLVSVVAERVNEKLYDTFMDAVIEFDGDAPAVSAYYLDELKELLL